jgi:hypothetical protein
MLYSSVNESLWDAALEIGEFLRVISQSAVINGSVHLCLLLSQAQRAGVVAMLHACIWDVHRIWTGLPSTLRDTTFLNL